MDAFECRAPCFAATDERQRRVFNPVTATTLVGKCAALLPPPLVRGRTVLDLGACLGAMCHWALCAGASCAVAVEVQPDFCARAAEMLARAAHTWPPHAAAEGAKRFAVVPCGVREYLSSCADDSFDVVVGAGLLHCFVDPVDIYLQMCRVARVAVVVEVDQPEAFQVGAVADGDPRRPLHTGSASLARGVAPAPHAAEGAALLQLAPRALVNRSGEDASFAGLSVVPSRPLLETIAAAFSFVPTRVRLAPHPTLDQEVRTYTGLRRFQATPRRFFLRCERPAGAKAVLGVPRSLEAAVTSGKGETQAWKNPTSWWAFQSAGAGAASSATVPEGTVPAARLGGAAAEGAAATVALPPRGTWSFDHEVASRFEHEARSHIPDYIEVVELSCHAVGMRLSASGLDPKGLSVTSWAQPFPCPRNHRNPHPGNERNPSPDPNPDRKPDSNPRP